MRALKVVIGLCAVSTASVLVACGGSSTTAQAVKAPVKTTAGPNDQSRCDYKGRADREVVESNGPGATVPNVRRVFGILGEGDDRRRVLFCREIDTNLDGLKDVVRMYNDKGDPVDEEADTDYDGKIDTWIKFAAGRIAKEERDRNRDGRPDETRYYVKGKLSRVQRDTNFDGKPDVWEVYANGQLERMGTDVDFDGHVDRWDRDEVAHRAAEEKERQEEEKDEAKKKQEEEANAAAAAPPGKATRPQDEKGKPAAGTPAATTSKPAAGTPAAGKPSTSVEATPPKGAAASSTKKLP